VYALAVSTGVLCRIAFCASCNGTPAMASIVQKV